MENNTFKYNPKEKGKLDGTYYEKERNINYCSQGHSGGKEKRLKNIKTGKYNKTKEQLETTVACGTCQSTQTIE